MPEENIALLVPGIASSRNPDLKLQQYLNIQPIGAREITATRGRSGETPLRVEGPPDSIVRVEYESGLVEYLRLDQFQAELEPARSAEAARVPLTLNRGAVPARGPAEWALKALHIFGVSPADTAAEKSAELIVRHFDAKLDTGLFRIGMDGGFQERIAQPLPEDSRPYLIFIHGTASSTQGSFGGFWRDAQTGKATPEWSNLIETYGDRIFALEHATLSLSPAQNALDLLALLPPNARLHVITHSRGGLVGELLGLGTLDTDDRKPLAGRPDAALFDELSRELTQKTLNVEKFVRTACPAAGTILASGRLDIYLNVILNVIGLIPGLAENPFYELFKATAIELIKLRANPEEIPGIEAQMPESPFIHLLNTKGRASNADLGVIAGSFQGAGVWSTLASYALRAFYWENNDFVVNTKSMAGGMDRKRKVEEFLDRGATVNHFSYFKNQSTRSKVLEWLAAPPGAEVEGFNNVRALVAPSRGPARRVEKKPLAVIVPDVFGTHLQRRNNTKVWLNYEELGKGAFCELADGALSAGDALDVYQPLFDALSSGYRTLLFAYDWRQSIESNAEKLNKWLGETRSSARFIGHGMGGLIVRQLAGAHPQRWSTLTSDGGKLLMLGTPNGGSWGIARVLAGRSRLVRMLALLGRHKNAEVAAVFQKMPGLIDLLPEAMLHPSAWKSESNRPTAQALAAGRNWRKRLAETQVPAGCMIYVAGCASATPSGMDSDSPEGDGDIANALGIDPAVKTWYNPDDAHGDLISHPAPLVQLLATGATTAYDSKFHPSMSAAGGGLTPLAREIAVLFPSESDLRNAALVRTETPARKTQAALKVRVTHAHLREARHPVAVGHYIGDGIVSAEAALDRQLNQRLSTRFHMDIYPGPQGTVEVVQAPGCDPNGAIVIGLGEVGEITPDKVRQGILEGCLQYALMKSEEPAKEGVETRSAAISSLLIGASGGRAIGIADSVTAVVRGIVEANRVLRRHESAKVRIDEVEFIELYEDAAIEAAKAAAALPEVLKNALEPEESIAFDDRLRSLSSGLSRRSINPYDTGWWRRIQIEGGKQDPTKPAQKLSFDNLTDRARAENTSTESQTSLINNLLEATTSQTSYDSATAVALFELLIPNSLKDQAADEANLVLVVDPAASRYPWELMAERSRDNVSPLAVRMGMIRQLKAGDFREGPQAARDHSALIIGDPTGFDESGSLPKLKGAREEAEIVTDLLSRNGYAANSLICKKSSEIVGALFARDYRILHLAGHGEYNPQDPARSGMILRWSDDDPGARVFLTAAEVGQIRKVPDLVFINCCHLGRIDQPLRIPAHRFAAGIAETLIRIGVKAVIAAGWAVDDAAAATFARSFYRSMLAGGKFGASVKEARADAFGLGNNNTWGAYQCYGNPDFALALNQEADRESPRAFYARRECLDELKDIAAQSEGANESEIDPLRQRIATAERALGKHWRDGESLFGLAEARRSTKDFELAVAVYQEAIGQETATAPIKAIEQLAYAMDRYAESSYDPQNPEPAEELWAKAEKHLKDLIGLLGESKERLSLLGALYKRRGAKNKNPQDLKRALDRYTRAYEYSTQVLKAADPYPGLNAIALAWLTGQTVAFEEECIAEAKSRRDAANLWDRIYYRDALMLEFLRNGGGTEKELVEGYMLALQHASPSQKKSVTDQIRYLIDQAPAERAQQARRLESILKQIL